MTHAHIHKVKKVPMKSKHRQIKGDKMVTDSIIIGASNAKVIAVNQSMLLSFEIAMMKIGATLFTTDFIVFFFIVAIAAAVAVDVVIDWFENVEVFLKNLLSAIKI